MGRNKGLLRKAYTEKNVLIHAKGTTADISVKADDDYKLIAVVGTISASGVAAVAVSVLTTVSYNTVSAEIGEGNTINAGRDIIIQAEIRPSGSGLCIYSRCRSGRCIRFCYGDRGRKPSYR